MALPRRGNNSIRPVEFLLLGNFHSDGNGLPNVFQFARLVEGVDEIAEGIKGHTPAKLTQNHAAGNAGKIYGAVAGFLKWPKSLPQIHAA